MSRDSIKVLVRRRRQALEAGFKQTAERLTKQIVARARVNDAPYVRDLMEKAGIEVDWRRYPW
jgi:hypothetical protein